MSVMFRQMWRLYRGAPRKAWFLRAQASLARALLPSRDRRAQTVVSADGTTLSARCSGQGDPIVLVHGGIGGKDLAFGFVEAALRDDYAVCPDAVVSSRRGRRPPRTSGESADLARADCCNRRGKQAPGDPPGALLPLVLSRSVAETH